MQTHSSSLIDKALKPLHDFLHLEAAGGLLLMMVTALALVVANLPLSVHYKAMLEMTA